MNYQKGYTLLFNRITDALEALEQQHDRQAGEILRRAQQDAEELYLSDSPKLLPFSLTLNKRRPR